MISFSVADITKLLEQIPIWKTLVTLPKQVKSLEDRVAALEGRQGPSGDKACPLCGETMKTTKVEPDPRFAFAGVQRHTLTCQCGHTESRQVDPRKK